MTTDTTKSNAQLIIEIEKLKLALKSAYGCLCYVQHNSNLDRSLIQIEIESIKEVVNVKS